MFAAVLDLLFFLFVTLFLVPSLVVFAHLMRSLALRAGRARESHLRQLDKAAAGDDYIESGYSRNL